MSEFLKSAFDYFGASGKAKGTNELIGNTFEVGSQLLKVINVIAEGGFAVVFEVEDTKSHNSYALKRLLSHDTDSSAAIMEEINYLKKLSGHSNIIRLITATSFPLPKPCKVGMEFLIVTELCAGGQVIQLMQRRNKPFPYGVTIQMFNHVCLAIEHMHRQTPPIIHRDLKVENLLINDKGVIKLCDFGSATTKVHSPDNSWSGQRRSEVQEEIEKHTTPMYRGPEMIDLYQNFPITTACDIWALGCVLYCFCFNKHPFEDSAKLAILNANYTIPSTNVDCSLIYQMLIIDPRQRLGISEIISEVRSKAQATNIQLKPTITFDNESLVHLPSINQAQDIAPQTIRNSMTRPPPPTRPPTMVPRALIDLPGIPGNNDTSQMNSPQTKHAEVPLQHSSSVRTPIHTSTNNPNDGKKVFGLLKDGAGSLMKNIRDVSNKVMEQVSSSINKTDLDLVYVTSRIIMMPVPAEAGIELLTKDKVDDVHTFLDFRHPNQYYIYNLGLKMISNEKFKDRQMHVGFDPVKPPPLNNLVTLCMHQLQWLLLDSKNVIVVQCADGRVASGINVIALFCLCRLVHKSADGAAIVKSRREECQFTPSQLRYADYICRLVKNIDNPSMGPDIPHSLSVIITSIELVPVPIFNKAKSGLRPFVEIFSDYKMIYTSVTSYEDIPSFTIDQKVVRIPVPNVSTQGDVNIVVYHTRSNIVAKGKIYTIKVCETQLYTGYLDRDCTGVSFLRQQLDNCDPEDDKYPNGFSCKINLRVTTKEAISHNQAQTLSWNSDKFKKEILSRANNNDRMAPFNSKDEMEACLTSSGIKPPVAKHTKPKLTDVENKSKNSQPKEDFFFSLDWTGDKENEINLKSSPLHLETHDTNLLIQNHTHNDSKPTEAVGDLLGDFESSGSFKHNKSTSGISTDADVYISELPGFTNKSPESSKDVDLLVSFANSGSKCDNNLLFFESSNSEKIQSFPFDPFGQSSVNSSSTVDLTRHQSNFEDWDADSRTNQKGQSIIKSSNSATNLLNMKDFNPPKLSPSFHSNDAPQKVDVFENFTAKNSSSKSVPPPKPKKNQQKPQEPVESAQPKNKKDAFQDLLGDFKPVDSAHNGSRSIKDIRKETMSRTTDPETLMILDWIDGKEKNIRALLCSLPSILWSEVRWPGVNMSELVTVDQVKRAYKNAIRCVHPDKWNNSEHKNLAKLIMIELNEAMSEFEAEKNACQ